MGWCSGTQIFDKVYEQVVDNPHIPDADQLQILITLADALEDHDWDCQEDSDYADRPMWKRVMFQLHSDWDWLSD